MPLSKFLPKDILVAGGSITGLTVAKRLIDLGQMVTVCEKALKPYIEKGRGGILHPSIIKRGMELGLFPKDLPQTLCMGKTFWIGSEIVRKEPFFLKGVNLEHIYDSLRCDFPQQSYFAGSKVEKISPIAKEGSKYFVQTDDSAHIVDNVIGADGIGSVVRRGAFPSFETPITGGVIWGGVISDHASVNNKLFNEHAQIFLFSGGRLEVCKIPAPDFHISKQMVLNWTLYENETEMPLHELFTDKYGNMSSGCLSADKLSTIAHAHLMQLVHSQLPGPIAEIMVKTGTPSLRLSHDFCLPNLNKGGIFLVGDAAAAVPDENTNLAKALTGAYNLVETLMLTFEAQPKSFTPSCDAKRCKTNKENTEKEIDNLCEQTEGLNLVSSPETKPRSDV